MIFTRSIYSELKMLNPNHDDFKRIWSCFRFEAIFEGPLYKPKKVSFWGQTYLCSLNYRIFVNKSFKNLCHTRVKKLIQKTTSIWMDENNKFMCEWNMLAFVHCSKFEFLVFKGLKSLNKATPLTQFWMKIELNRWI